MKTLRRIRQRWILVLIALLGIAPMMGGCEKDNGKEDWGPMAPMYGCPETTFHENIENHANE